MQSSERESRGTETGGRALAARGVGAKMGSSYRGECLPEEEFALRSKFAVTVWLPKEKAEMDSRDSSSGMVEACCNRVPGRETRSPEEEFRLTRTGQGTMCWRSSETRC